MYREILFSRECTKFDESEIQFKNSRYDKTTSKSFEKSLKAILTALSLTKIEICDHQYDTVLRRRVARGAVGAVCPPKKTPAKKKKRERKEKKKSKRT